MTKEGKSAMSQDDNIWNFHTYQPESSDKQRFGDWQTKLTAVSVVVIFIAVVLAWVLS
jgi:hypothetical protein